MEHLTHHLEAGNRPPLDSQLNNAAVNSRLFLILVIAILVTVGPVAFRTAAGASLVLIQIFLELGQFCLAVFQIFGA